MLRVLQPGVVGLMDGSISTLASIFASAFATREPFITVLIGLKASLGAGISRRLPEALLETGELTNPSNPAV